MRSSSDWRECDRRPWAFHSVSVELLVAVAVLAASTGEFAATSTDGSEARDDVSAASVKVAKPTAGV